MQLNLTAAVVAPATLVVLGDAGSTNDELRALANASLSHPGGPLGEFSTVVTTNQTAGRGRLGRVWVAPPGQTVAMSVLLRPTLQTGGPLPVDFWGWIPLIAGVAMARAVASLLPDSPVALKWPNDVQVGGLKVCGILAELLADGAGIVLGLGLNTAIPAEGLPTTQSTSLLVERERAVTSRGESAPRHDPAAGKTAAGSAQLTGDALVDAACSRWHTEFRRLYGAFTAASGDAEASGIRSVVTGACSTLGQRVRVQLPGGADLVGTAVDIDDHGRLRIRDDSDATLQAVAAGDVTHLRYE